MFMVNSTDTYQSTNDNYTSKDISVWVNASAGSGKTKILVDRIVALLMQGVEMKNILCLTYTNAAASEMRQRIAKELLSWHKLDEPKLLDKLSELKLSNKYIDTKKAQNLVFEYINNKDELKIFTIHAFAKDILSRFSGEAGLQNNFKIIDPIETKKIFEEAWYNLLKNQDENIVYILDKIHHAAIEDLISEVISYSWKFQELISIFSFQEQAFKALDELFQADSITTLEKLLSDLRNDIISLNITDVSECLAFININDYNNFIKLTKLLLTEELQPRKRIKDEKLIILQNKILEIIEQINKFDNYQSARHLLLFAFSLLKSYNTIKEQRNCLDFFDLTHKLLNLLTSKDETLWILFKLDANIKHILVDEAQDTSLNQWLIISKLTEEFFSNGNTEKGSSIFVVGDTKQSIYSFQGARPAFFDFMKKKYQELCTDNFFTLSELRLDKSYRSLPNILKFVDNIFYDSVMPTKHTAHRAGYGTIALWNKITDVERVEAKKILAQKLACTINIWIKHRTPQIKPADIMILVRKRDEFVKFLVKELKILNIAVIDGTSQAIHSSLIVKDILSLIKFIALPYNDLNLAQLLKSSFFDIAEKEIELLVFKNKNLNLWQNFCQQPESEMLKNIFTLQGLYHPCDYISILLDQFCKPTLVKIYGAIADEMIRTIKDICELAKAENIINYEDLSSFIKQKLEYLSNTVVHDSDAVSILTVHGSKGLQAPIIFVIDDESIVNNNRNFLLWDEQSGLPLLRHSTKKSCTILSTIKKQETDLNVEEYNRLLYVALTRAENELHIASYCTSHIEGSWYSKAQSVFFSASESILEINDFQYIGDSIILTDTQQHESISHDIVQDQSPITTDYKLNFKTHDFALNLVENNDKQNIGTIIHKILQFLNKDTINQHDTIVRNILGQENINDEEKSEIKTIISFIVSNNELKKLLTRDCLTEFQISSLIKNHHEIHRVDRIIIDNNVIDVLDYKLSWPHDVAIQIKYKSQLQKYVDLLQNLYPNHIINGSILDIKEKRLIKLVSSNSLQDKLFFVDSD